MASGKVRTRISKLSSEPLWVSFRIEHPVSGFVDVTLDNPIPDVAVAIVTRAPDPADFVTGVLDPLVLDEAGQSYNLVQRDVVASSLEAGKHQVWVRVQRTGATEPMVIRSGEIDVY